MAIISIICFPMIFLCFSYDFPMMGAFMGFQKDHRDHTNPFHRSFIGVGLTRHRRRNCVGNHRNSCGNHRTTIVVLVFLVFSSFVSGSFFQIWTPWWGGTGYRGQNKIFGNPESGPKSRFENVFLYSCLVVQVLGELVYGNGTNCPRPVSNKMVPEVISWRTDEKTPRTNKKSRYANIDKFTRSRKTRWAKILRFRVVIFVRFIDCVMSIDIKKPNTCL